VGKTFQKLRQKNEGQKYAVWLLSKNAHRRAAKLKYFSALHFSVMSFFKS
jgi:hypothetical protein